MPMSEVLYVDNESKKKINTDTYIHIDGTKVYRLGKENTKYQDTWLLLYDFGLQPGDTMVGYSYVVGNQPTEYLYKCLSIRDDFPGYKGLKVMSLAVTFPDKADNLEIIDYVGARWIMGYGSTEGLLTACSALWTEVLSSSLTQLDKGSKKIFSRSDVPSFIPPWIW